MFGKLVIGICGAFLINLLFTPRAYAYIDPGTGAMLLQVLAACLVAVGVFWKRLWGVAAVIFGRKALDKDEKRNSSDE